MSNSPSLNQINKIHINSSTKMTLSDRFTAFSAKPKIVPRTTRQGFENPVSRVASIANRRLLKQLAQKHTMEAALKLKRRSMKARVPTTSAYTRVSNGQPLKRGTIKALRLGPNGRPLKANSISNVATMEADLMSRRSHSVSRIGIGERVGGRRAQGNKFSRRASRPLWGGDATAQIQSGREPPAPIAAGMRSRSRSRTRQVATVQSPRSSQAGISGRLARGRSNSRSRPILRSRSRSRNNRNVNRTTGIKSVPIQSRLGKRPNAVVSRARSVSRSGQGGGRRARNGGVAGGRIQKRRNSVKAVLGKGVGGGSVQSRLSRPKTRLPPTIAANQRMNRSASKRGIAARGRARSKSRADNRTTQRNNSTVIAKRQQRGRIQQGRAAIRSIGRRGRSQQRGGPTMAGGVAQRNGNSNGQQQRRGRSRSRGRARGGRNLGVDKPEVKKEDLDKELDQYMSSTKSDGLFS